MHLIVAFCDNGGTLDDFGALIAALCDNSRTLISFGVLIVAFYDNGGTLDDFGALIVTFCDKLANHAVGEKKSPLERRLKPALLHRSLLLQNHLCFFLLSLPSTFNEERKH